MDPDQIAAEAATLPPGRYYVSGRWICHRELGAQRKYETHEAAALVLKAIKSK